MYGASGGRRRSAAGKRAKLARHPALVRQRALKIFADHPFDQRRAGDQPVEGRTLDVVQGGGGVRCGGQRKGQEKMKTVGVHDAAHCRAKSASIPTISSLLDEPRQRRLVLATLRTLQQPRAAAPRT
jgi:hypothetical protein